MPTGHAHVVRPRRPGGRAAPAGRAPCTPATAARSCSTTAPTSHSTIRSRAAELRAPAAAPRRPARSAARCASRCSGRGAVARPHARNSSAPDPLRVVHARQRRDDDPRRVAVVQREVRAADPQRQQRARVGRPGRRASVAWRSTPARLQRLDDAARAGRRRPARRASSASGTPVHVWRVDQPSTQPSVSVCVACGSASSSSRVSATLRGPPAQHEPVAGADHRPAVTSAPRRGLVDREAARRAAARGTRCARSGPPIDCAGVRDEQRGEPPPTAASRPRRLIVGGSGATATRSPSGSGRVARGRRAAAPARRASGTRAAPPAP